MQQINSLDKSKPVLIYCRSGNRSGQAAEKLKEMGFREIYDMKDGITGWMESGKSLSGEQNEAGASGITPEKFQSLLAGNSIVFVDFNAPWCGPCRKLSPILDEIANEKGSGFKLVKINVDENEDLASSMAIENLPTLHLYKDQKMVWRSEGFMNKDQLLRVIEQYMN